jgi:hypothetical protein
MTGEAFMYIINLRHNGNDGNTFTETERIFNLEHDKPTELISDTELLLSVKQKNILILLHGFHQSTSDVLSFYLTMDKQHRKFLSGYYDAVVGFIWPGGESKFNYYQSKQNVRRAGSYLQNWIDDLNKAQCTIDVMSHGMGSLLIYHSLDLIQKDFSIRNVFSIGAGIPQEVLTNDLHIERVQHRVEKIYLFYIENKHTQVDLSQTVNQNELKYEEPLNWEKELSKMKQINLINITEKISNFPGYQSLIVITECIDKLLSGSRYPQHTLSSI